MKPSELNLADYASFIADAKKRYDPDVAKRRTSFESGTGFLKKFKLEPNTAYNVLVPLELCIPFNPDDLSTDEFDRNNPLPLPGSPSTVVKRLRAMAKDRQDFAEKLASSLGVTVDKLKVDSTEIDKSDVKLWHRLCRMQYITGYVQHLNTNKEKFSFGRKVGADVQLTDDGSIAGTTGAGYQLYEMENAFISVEIQTLRDTFEPGGVNADRPKKELEEKTKALWSDRLIGNPYQIAFCRCIPFTASADGTLAKGDASNWAKSKKIGPLIRYMKVTRDRIDLFESVLTSKSDMYMDFIETQINVPKSEEGNKVNYMGVNYANANQSSSVFQIDDSTGEPLNDLTGFIDEFITYRDDDKVWNDDILRRSIIEYRVPSDDQLCAEISSSLSIYENAMKSESIFHDYGEIIQRISSSLHADIAEKILDGDVTNKDKSIEIIDNAPVMNENTDDLGSELDSLLNNIDNID